MWGHYHKLRADVLKSSIYKRYLTSLPEAASTIQKFRFKKHTHAIKDINDNATKLIEDSIEVTLNGWIDGTPRKLSKKLIFSHFRDFNSDHTQIVTKDEALSQKLRALKPEDPISITGTISLKKSHSSDEESKWELIATSIQLLNPTATSTTSQLDSLKTTPSQYPPEYRYLQLRHPYYQRSLKQRALAASIIRSTLSTKHDLTEIETPILFKSTPEGAKEFLVPSRTTNPKGSFYALPQSPQQYKQLLMASGVKGYYQIARCFRDEDLRADRQPEFTQVDLELAWCDGEDVRKVVRSVVGEVWKSIRGLPLYRVDFETGDLVEVGEAEQFPELSYKDALSKFGIDKPDLRSRLEFVDLSEAFDGPLNSPSFPVTEACVLKGALTDSEKLPKQLFDSNEYKVRRPYIIKIKDKDALKTWNKELPINITARVEALNAKLNLEVGDIVAISDRATLSYENPTPLGRFRQLAVQYFPTKWRRDISSSSTPQSKPENIFVCSWVVDFPLFSPIEVEDDLKGQDVIKQPYPLYDFNAYESTHHPFTMAKLDDYPLLQTDPLKVHGDHYDLVINGVELGGGSRRIHDSELQMYIFKEILKIENPMALFGHLLNAFESGCPPHAGLALGFDRLCAMLMNTGSIRDVVAFPKTQAGIDPVVESPSVVPEKVLDLYHIRVKQ
ncbi:hypothetical protein CANARDRAFT_8718 [[Candida] arabinofermentans NRRL YB-2248]|uniref:Aminoacyl-transfer RNA synthetases class-II family profile domain-containing protein n=1 Tax=[Candida] arabinofermentans NRRL YB-2248 TaxID=983967 RepID=A0A1E4SXY9_9ASCO|nr:hypothetical protein CANARDRAFT_8718 [[Candida] arabinofermentans NRRL YB-2248]